MMKLEKSKWETVKLEEVCVIDPSKKELTKIDEETEVSFGMMVDLGEHKREFSPIETRKFKDVSKGGLSYFREKDILLAKMTPCFENGKSGIALNLKNGIGFGSTEFYVLRSNGRINPELIYHIVSSEKFLEDGKFNLIGTTGRRRLIKRFVESFPINLPPLPEQQRIAALFESLEAAVKSLEAQEGSLRKMRKVLVDGLVQEKPVFGELLSAKNCKPGKFSDIAGCVEQHDKNPASSGITHFIGLENIEADNFDLQGRGEIEKGTTFTKRFSKGDVLFGKRRAYLKKVAVADFDGICSGDILVFRAKPEMMLPELLPFYTAADAFIDHAVNTSAGSLSPRTKWKDLAGFEISIPGLEVQKQIADVFLQLQKLLGYLKTQKTTLKTLKQRLLNEILG